MTVGSVLVLIGAGVAAGLSGSVAGLASLFSYPALLAVGLPATTANVTNTVALTMSSVGATIGSRPELTGQEPVLRRYALLAAVGGAAGAGLLLVTPPGAFERIVPVLVAAASIVLFIQPRIRRAAAPDTHTSGLAVAASVLAVTVYGGYFGAAAGVLMLAILVVGLPVSVLQGNAIKNVLLGLANTTAAIGFAVLAPVQWWAVVPLAAGVFAGSFAGPAVARSVPTGLLRTGIGLAGLVLAAALAVEAW